MKKEKYINPEIKIIEFSQEDIMTVSINVDEDGIDTDGRGGSGYITF